MKTKLIIRILAFFSLLVLLLIFTNPSNKLYTEYLKANRYEVEPYHIDDFFEPKTKPSWGVRYNYLIFTTFKYNDGIIHYDIINTKPIVRIKKYKIRNHIGILSNFYELSPTWKTVSK